MASSFDNGESTVTFNPTSPTNRSPVDIDITSDPGQKRGAPLDNDQGKPNLDKAGVINWLGSSFSGVDIKAIAHLYDTVSNDERVGRIQSEKDYAIAMRDGIQQLTAESIAEVLFTAVTFDETRNALAFAAGLSNPISIGQIRAARDVVNLAYSAVSVGTRDAVPLQLQPNYSLANPLLERVRKTWNQVKASEVPRYEAQIGYFDDQIIAVQETVATETKTLGELQTISVETHRTKQIVRALGTSFPKGVVRGDRTFAGSMIFTVFDRHPLLELQRAMQSSKTYGEIDKASNLSTYLPDQLPPIDITIVFANEYGSLSEMRLYGVEFVNDSVTYSIEDLFTENICNFIARDIDVMTPRGKVRLSRLQRGMHFDDEGQELTGSDLLLGNDLYEKYIDKIGVRRRKINI